MVFVISAFGIGNPDHGGKSISIIWVFQKEDLAATILFLDFYFLEALRGKRL